MQICETLLEYLNVTGSVQLNWCQYTRLMMDSALGNNIISFHKTSCIFLT